MYFFPAYTAAALLGWELGCIAWAGCSLLFFFHLFFSSVFFPSNYCGALQQRPTARRRSGEEDIDVWRAMDACVCDMGGGGGAGGVVVEMHVARAEGWELGMR